MQDFYWDAYHIVREQAPTWLFLMHDSFNFDVNTWGDFMKNCPAIGLDTHLYQVTIMYHMYTPPLLSVHARPLLMCVFWYQRFWTSRSVRFTADLRMFLWYTPWHSWLPSFIVYQGRMCRELFCPFAHEIDGLCGSPAREGLDSTFAPPYGLDDKAVQRVRCRGAQVVSEAKESFFTWPSSLSSRLAPSHATPFHPTRRFLLAFALHVVYV